MQVSLVQFTSEPVLEFSFRKHNCKPCLIADIADTEYMNGVSNLGNAIQKAAKYGFSKRRVCFVYRNLVQITVINKFHYLRITANNIVVKILTAFQKFY